MRPSLFIVCTCFAILFKTGEILAQDLKSLQALLKDGGLYAETLSGKPLVNIRGERAFTPASTIKLATAFCSLEALSTEHRFKTFFFSSKDSLYVKSLGDPSLVSSEIRRIVESIAPVMKTISSVVIDNSAFALDELPDGTNNTLNPYDAKNGAFIVNFGSALISRKSKNGILSGESETPLTALSRRAGLRIPIGRTDRINIASTPKLGSRYGAEILIAMLRQRGVKGAMNISFGLTPKSAHLIHTHLSSETLESIAKGMLKYSTNFTANQLMLTLGGEMSGYPATLKKGQHALSRCLKKIGWSEFHVEEGSGLSRRTTVTPVQLVSLLHRFVKYKHLLPEKMGFLAKTGSLRGVNALAGYFQLHEPKEQTVAFAILINRQVPHLYKYTVAKKLRTFLQNNASVTSR